jgi:hypothetical protein
MSTQITLGQTAMAPGQDSSHAWDYWWRDLSSLNEDFLPSGLPDWTSIGWYFGASPTGLGLGLEIMLDTTWNTVKDIELTQLDCTWVTVEGFVDTCIAAVGDDMSHQITVVGAKRGAIDLGDGKNTITIDYLSNEYTWSNNFTIAAGNGNDTILVRPELSQWIGAPGGVPKGWTFNTAPDQTTVDSALGSGNNTLGLEECSGTITASSGASNISLMDGHNTLTLGSGTATVTIASYNIAWPAIFALATDRASDIVQLGSGHADISIDDTMTFMTPLTTIVVTHGQTGDETADGPDDIRYGHGAGSDFVGGNWSALTLDLVGYSAGSSATLTAAGDHTELTIKDAAGGAADVLNLYGASPPSIATLHLHFT